MSNKTMTPSRSRITDGQISKLCQNFTAKIKKGSEQLPSNLVQCLLSDQTDNTLVDKLFKLILNETELLSNTIYRHVNVNRQLSPEEMINATGRNDNVSNRVLQTIPRGKGKITEIVLFSLDGRTVTDEQLDDEYEIRNLDPADPYSLSALNQDDPEFADKHPNCTHWINEKGEWCYITFGHAEDRFVHVDSVDDASASWDTIYFHRDAAFPEYENWWYAGIRKQKNSRLIF